MAKKTYNIEFIYLDENRVGKMHSVANINITNKNEVIQKICQWLILKKKAVSIVIREICVYKVL